MKTISLLSILALASCGVPVEVATPYGNVKSSKGGLVITTNGPIVINRDK